MNGADARGPGVSGWVRIALVVVLVVGSTLAFRASGVADSVTVGQLHGLRSEAGALAPLLFVVVYVVGTVLAFPGLLLTLAGGLLFGTLLGGSLVWAGASGGALLAFVVGRRLGRSAVERFPRGGRLARFDRAVSGSGFSAVLFTRLVPVVPFNVVNYLWGLSGVSLRDYTLATVFGMIPAEFVYANIGGALARSLEGHDDVTLASLDYRAFLNVDVALALALLGVMAIVPSIVRIVRRSRSA